MASLTIVSGVGAGNSYRLPADRDSMIGRGGSCDISILDPHMSREHCVVCPGKTGFTIKDKDSANGVVLNDKRVKEAVLKDGDKIRLGATHLEFFLAEVQADADTEKISEDEIIEEPKLAEEQDEGTSDQSSPAD